MIKKLTLAVLATLSTAALADINVGVSVAATGPAASLGIPEKNTFALLPTTIGGQKVNYIVLDDATDPTAATKNIKKLISENKVDVVVGSSTTPSSLAMMDVAVENETPLISMAGSAIVVEPMDDKRKWVFKTAQNDAHMATAHGPAHDRQERPDRRFHRFRRRLRRGLVQGVCQDRRSPQAEDRRQRALSSATTPR